MRVAQKKEKVGCAESPEKEVRLKCISKRLVRKRYVTIAFSCGPIRQPFWNQDIAKSFIRESNIDYFPSLIKTQHFNDAASDLTIFVEEENQEGFIKNIFIKDNSSENSQIISAKSGMIAKKNELYFYE